MAPTVGRSKRKYSDSTAEIEGIPVAKRTRSVKSTITTTKKAPSSKAWAERVPGSVRVTQRTLHANSAVSKTAPKTPTKTSSKAAIEASPKTPRKKGKKRIAEPEFWDSQFMQVETIPRSVTLDDLTNGIHPIFQEAIFPKDDYYVIAPSARLATRFLESPITLSFLLTLMYHGPLTDLREAREDRGKSYGYSKKDTNTSKIKVRRGVRLEEDRVRRDAGLLEVATMVKFIHDRGLPDGAMSEQERLPLQPPSEWFTNARATKIKYSDALFQKLYNATTVSGGVALVLAYRFELALMLVHEVCHALVNAKEGNLSSEPFFYGSDFAEVGFELEDRLFGGHFSYSTLLRTILRTMPMSIDILLEITAWAGIAS